jgi:phenylalanyl-tRNA synthetase alpha chain
MSQSLLTPHALRSALATRDLTDPTRGPHAVQLVLHSAVAALRTAWRCESIVERADPVVPIADNYDRLRYPPGGAARDARYTRYVSTTHLLRTQTSAMIPPLLRRLAPAPPEDALLVCAGIVYRRDAIDRLHTGEPHQADLWRVRRSPPLGAADLREMVAVVARAVASALEVRTSPADHPYTLGGLQIDVRAGGRWVEIGECGVAHPEVLRGAGTPPEWTGLAMGLGLDRLVMIAKGLDDIRLLRSDDPRIASQMLDLSPWRPVSRHPPVRRDLSVAVAMEADAETLGDRVREALGTRASDVEAIEVLSETPTEVLLPAARVRLGIGPGQKNVLLRLVLRAPGRTLTDQEANLLRDDVYAAIHQGTAHQWAGRTGGPER